MATLKSFKSKEVKKGFLENLLEDVKENISEGTKIISEKSSEVLDVVKEKSGEAYKAGSIAIGAVNEKVHDFTEKQKLQKEEKEAEEKRDVLIYNFGLVVLEEYLESGSVHKRFLTKSAVNDMVEEIKALDSRLFQIEKKLAE